MSNIHNERIKENILEDVLSLSINDLQNELESMKLKHHSVAIDYAINDLVDVIFEDMEDIK